MNKEEREGAARKLEGSRGECGIMEGKRVYKQINKDGVVKWV